MRSIALRASLALAAGFGTSACANEPIKGAALGSMMMLNGTAQAAPAPVMAPQPEAASNDDLSRKSFAAKVLASRALESVTGLKADPARLSEHD
jgi:hypothetical protein